MNPDLSKSTSNETGSNTKTNVPVKTAEWLNNELEQAMEMVKSTSYKENIFSVKLILLDCRSPIEFKSQHIVTSFSIFLPELAMRRLVSGRLPIDQLFKTEKQHLTFSKRPPDASVVLYSSSITDTIQKLANRLKDEVANVYILKGGFKDFFQNYRSKCCTEKCTCLEFYSKTSSIYAVRTFDERSTSPESSDKVKYVSSNSKMSCKKQLSIGECLTVLKVPHGAASSTSKNNQELAEIVDKKLYLGNMKQACDIEVINKYGITHILNVTNDQPNFFQNMSNISYSRLSLEDSSFNDVIQHLPTAFNFIDEAINNKDSAILVHCLAGVSRSSTVVIAYLMARRGFSLDTAHDHVRVRKSDIWPNFGFMEQLRNLDLVKNLQNPQSAISSNCVAVNNSSFSFKDILSKSSEYFDSSDNQAQTTTNLTGTTNIQSQTKTHHHHHDQNPTLETTNNHPPSQNKPFYKTNAFAQPSCKIASLPQPAPPSSDSNNCPSSAPAFGYTKSVNVFTFQTNRCGSYAYLASFDNNKNIQSSDVKKSKNISKRNSAYFSTISKSNFDLNQTTNNSSNLSKLGCGQLESLVTVELPTSLNCSNGLARSVSSLPTSPIGAGITNRFFI